MKSQILIISLFILFFSNYLQSQVIPNDADFDKQWYLYMPGNDQTRADIRVLDAWQRATGNSTQKIADIEDSYGAFPALHEDLDNNRIITQGGGIASGEHSTLIAGILIATHNTIGIAGINNYAKLYSYVYDTYEHWADKIRDARLDGNKIINISQGTADQLIDVYYRIAEAHENNIITVVSTGNQNTNITNPATFPGVIAVGSSTKLNARSYFSNSGPQIKFLAPGGSDFSSTNANNIYSTSSDGSYIYAGGTSLSAPQVSGAASLLLDYWPILTNDDILNILINSCDKLPEMQGQNFTNTCGYGRINLKKAFQLLEPPHVRYTGTATLTRLAENTFQIFYNNPVLATGTYIVDKYKLYYDNDNIKFQEPPLAWLARGYSPASTAG